MMKLVTAAFTATAVSIVTLSAAAQAKSYDIRVTATVPTSCQASISPALTQISADTYRIGRLSQFCNTAYQMSFNYSGAASNARFRVRGAERAAGAGSTLVTANGQPINGASDVYLLGVSQAEAQAIASSLSVSVTPLGL